MIVLVGAGLCVRSLRNLYAIDTGFDPAKVLVMSVDVSLSGYSRERGLQFYSELLERVQRLPGVEAVSLATQIALGDGFGATMRADGYAPKPGEDMSSDFNQIGPDYFRRDEDPAARRTGVRPNRIRPPRRRSPSSTRRRRAASGPARVPLAGA